MQWDGGGWVDDVVDYASEAGVSDLLSNASLAVDLEVGLHYAIAFFVDLLRRALVAPTTAHVHTTSVSGAVQTADSGKGEGQQGNKK